VYTEYPMVQLGVGYAAEDIDPDNDPGGILRDTIVRENAVAISNRSLAARHKLAIYTLIWDTVSRESQKQCYQEQLTNHLDPGIMNGYKLVMTHCCYYSTYALLTCSQPLERPCSTSKQREQCSTACGREERRPCTSTRRGSKTQSERWNCTGFRRLSKPSRPPTSFRRWIPDVSRCSKSKSTMTMPCAAQSPQSRSWTRSVRLVDISPWDGCLPQQAQEAPHHLRTPSSQ
jgi:hypothetical protein